MKLRIAIVLCIFLSTAFSDGRQQCGRAKTTDHQYIVGGEKADDHEFPFAAALIRGRYVFCGGSIINKRYILTAAHCVEDIQSHNMHIYRVRVGSNHRFYGGQLLNFEKIIIHPKYQNVKNVDEGYDVALIKTKETILFNDNVYNVCLAEHDFDLSNYYEDKNNNCVVAGWGATNSDEYDWDTLNKVEIPIIPWDKCSEKLSSFLWGNFTNQICAGFEEGGKDSCINDSGGFLNCPVGDSYVQVGIVSWGKGCGNPRYPGVYANVMEVNGWIKENSDWWHTSKFLDIMYTKTKKYDRMSVKWAKKHRKIPNELIKQCKGRRIRMEVRDAATMQKTPEEQGIKFNYWWQNTEYLYKCFYNRNNGKCPKQLVRFKCINKACVKN